MIINVERLGSKSELCDCGWNKLGMLNDCDIMVAYLNLNVAVRIAVGFGSVVALFPIKYYGKGILIVLRVNGMEMNDSSDIIAQ
jgi:hypothetical protein